MGSPPLYLCSTHAVTVLPSVAYEIDGYRRKAIEAYRGDGGGVSTRRQEIDGIANGKAQR